MLHQLNELVGWLVGMSVSLCTFPHAEHNYVSCELQNHIWLHECTRQTVIQWSRSLMIYNTRRTTTSNSSSSVKEEYKKTSKRKNYVRFSCGNQLARKNKCIRSCVVNV